LDIGEYTRALQLDPNYAWAYLHRGVAYHNQIPLQNQNAINDYTKAIQLDPDYALAYNSWGGSYGMLEQYENSISDYTKAIQLDPNYSNAYSGRSSAHRLLGQRQRWQNDGLLPEQQVLLIGWCWGSFIDQMLTNFLNNLLDQKNVSGKPVTICQVHGARKTYEYE
jgi:tetratricopeptide (TPR) repeat protein